MELGGDLRKCAKRTLGYRGQSSAGAADLLGKCVGRSRQVIVTDKGPDADGAHHIGEQRIRGERRLQLKRGRGESRRVAVPTAKRILQLKTDEAHLRGAGRFLRCGAGIVELERNALAVIDQRGIAGNPPAVANKAQRLRQISEIPELDAAALKPRAVRRERELRRLAQLGTQRREVAALSKLLAGGIDHTDVRL